MPDILVEVKDDWLGGEGAAFLAAINRALAQALQTPREETILRLIEHPAASFIIPAVAGGRFTRIEIAMFQGRSLDAKRRLYRAIVEELNRFAVPAEDVKVVLIEVSAENVGIRSGKAAVDVDLGYEVRV